MPGVNIGDDSILGAIAVVTRGALSAWSLAGILRDRSALWWLGGVVRVGTLGKLSAWSRA